MMQEDRRIRRTRKLLNEALVDLITEKAYGEITVQDITEKADIGHRTFYRHYASKDELLVEVMKDTLSGFQDLLVLPTSTLIPSDELGDIPRNNGRRLFEYVEKNEALFRVLFQEGPVIYQPMLDLARRYTTNLLHGIKDEHDSPIPYHILANHLTTSTLELMKLWLEDGKPRSADVMGGYLVQMVFKPMRDLLGEKR